MAAGNDPAPSFPVSLRSCSAVMVRKAASEFAPAASANLTPIRSASAWGSGLSVPMYDPLSPIAPVIKSFESGDAISALTAIDPADSPPIVMRFGSPPTRPRLAAARWWS